MKVREVDRTASQIDPSMDEEDKGFVRTAMMGGTMAKQEIAQFNEDCDEECDYCKDGASTASHTRWTCSFFEAVRKETDEGLAAIPRKYFIDCIRCGIAPALKPDGTKTFWGMDVQEEESEKTKRLLGINRTLHTPGTNAEETEKREMALEILEEPSRSRRNARRIMLEFKGAHGTGIDPDFPTEDQIKDNMQGHDDKFKVEVYGDGSYTTPTKWWAALGGQGAWVKDWNLPGEDKESRREEDIANPALGQNGSSTRQELAAWILVLTRPFRSRYSTDSASMKGKAEHIIRMATEIQKKESEGIKVTNKSNPYKKTWGLQRDGDLWEMAWKAILKRGANSQEVRKVKGHATKQDIEEGRSNAVDKEGNDRSDENADEGVLMIGGAGLVRLGKWLTDRHDSYIAFMRRVQRMIVAVTKA